MAPARRQRKCPIARLQTRFSTHAAASVSPPTAPRQAQNPNGPLDPDVIKKRTKRHLDELEVGTGLWSRTLRPRELVELTRLNHVVSQRSNYSEPTGSGAASGAGGEGDEDDEGVAPGGRTAKGRARQATISDKRQWDGRKPKKSTMNVRTAILYKKNLAVLLDESVSTALYSVYGSIAHSMCLPIIAYRTAWLPNAHSHCRPSGSCSVPCARIHLMNPCHASFGTCLSVSVSVGMPFPCSGVLSGY